MSTCLNDVPAAAVVAAGFPPATFTDSTAGPAVDLAAGDGPCFAVQLVGAAGADTTLYGSLEQSADGTAWAAIPGSEFTPVDAPDTVRVIRFARSARYVRWTGVADGGGAFAVAVVFGQGRKLI